MTAPKQRAAAFYLSRLLSQAAQGVFLGALFWKAGAGGAAVSGFSGVFVAMMAASLLLAMPAGVLIDSTGAGRGLAIGAWLRVAVAATAALAVGSATGAFAVAFAYSAVSQVFSHSEMALVHAFQGERPARGHAALMVLQYVGQGAGLAIAGPALYYFGGTQMMFLGATGIFAAVGMLAVIASPGRPVATQRRAGLSLGPTLRLLRDDGAVASASALLVYFELSVKAMTVAVPTLLFGELGLGMPAVVALLLPAALGGLLGIWLISTQTGPEGAVRMARPVFAGMAGLTLMLAVFANGLPVAYGGAIDIAGLVPVAAGLGLCLAMAPVCGRAVLTQQAPRSHQARVFATQGVLSDVVVLVPLAVAGIGTSVAGAGTTFLFLATVGGLLWLTLEHALPRWRQAPLVPLVLAPQPVDDPYPDLNA